MSEKDFWKMTLGEIDRYLEAYNRREMKRLKEKAVFDYRLAELVGISAGRYFAKSFSYPELYTVYPSLFSKEEIEEERRKNREEKSINRLIEFVNKHNEEVNKWPKN